MKKGVVEIKRWVDDSVIATGDEGETFHDLVIRKIAEGANVKIPMMPKGVEHE